MRHNDAFLLHSLMNKQQQSGYVIISASPTLSSA